jgi:hypothetical protein
MKKSTFESHWKSYFLLGIACLQPVANYSAINFTDQAFVPSRSVLHFFILFFIACLLLWHAQQRT